MSNPTFEEQLKYVENIAEQLEGGNLGLDDMMKKYQDGMTRLVQLEKELGEARQKLTQIRHSNAGQPTEVPMDAVAAGQGGIV